MSRYRVFMIMVAAGCAAFAVVSAEGATRADFAAKCGNSWAGSKTTAAFRAYQVKCINAAIAATNAATDAGNPTNVAANRTRAQAACGARFQVPRNTAAKRAAYSSCVVAARASQLAFAGRPLKAVLLGSNEVPAAGGASGSALIRLNQGQRRVCFTISVTGLGTATATAAHIHRGVAGTNGPPIVAFSDIASLNRSPSRAKGCVQNVAASTIRDIRQHPERYYVNVHDTLHQDGAARGQLSK
jgi:hypothetical protein